LAVRPELQRLAVRGGREHLGGRDVNGIERTKRYGE
jgi:hypothetical protein